MTNAKRKLKRKRSSSTSEDDQPLAERQKQNRQQNFSSDGERPRKDRQLPRIAKKSSFNLKPSDANGGPPSGLSVQTSFLGLPDSPWTPTSSSSSQFQFQHRPQLPPQPEYAANYSPTVTSASSISQFRPPTSVPLAAVPNAPQRLATLRLQRPDGLPFDSYSVNWFLEIPAGSNLSDGQFAKQSALEIFDIRQDNATGFTATWRSHASLANNVLPDLIRRLRRHRSNSPDLSDRGFALLSLHPDSALRTVPETIATMHQQNRTAVVFLDSHVAFLSHHSAFANQGFDFRRTTFENDWTLAVLLVSATYAENSGISLRNAATEWASDRICRNPSLLNEQEFRLEAWSRAIELPKLGIDGKTFLVFGSGSECEDLRAALRRVGGTEVSAKPDFVFIQRRAIKAFIAHAYNRLIRSPSNIYEFGLPVLLPLHKEQEDCKQACNYLHRIWPKGKLAVIQFTYAGLLESGKVGVEALFAHYKKVSGFPFFFSSCRPRTFVLTCRLLSSWI